MTWQESVKAAIQRLVQHTGKSVFTRQDLIESELDRIVNESDSSGQTPEYTLSRVLQELRNQEVISFESPGVYRLLPADDREPRTLFQIPVSEISPNPHNPRLIFDPQELDELKGSIQKVGILVPVTVYRNTKPYPKTNYVLLDGERRWRCATELQLPSIPANVIDEPRDVTQNILFMFNIHHYRREWELFPTALKLEKLMEAMGTDQESVLANFTGVSRSTIRRCKKLLWFPEKYRKVLMERNSKISTDFFIEIHPITQRLSHEDEYPFPEGIIKITDTLMEKFTSGKTVTDVKEFREIRRAMAFYEDTNSFGEFKRRFAEYLENPAADMRAFTVAMEDERNVTALLKYAGYMQSILQTINPAILSDVFVVEPLKSLSVKLNKILDEID